MNTLSYHTIPKLAALGLEAEILTLIKAELAKTAAPTAEGRISLRTAAERYDVSIA